MRSELENGLGSEDLEGVSVSSSLEGSPAQFKTSISLPRQDQLIHYIAPHYNRGTQSNPGCVR